MSVPAHEQRVARARQIQADVLVHEVYESGSKGSNMSGSDNVSVVTPKRGFHSRRDRAAINKRFLSRP